MSEQRYYDGLVAIVVDRIEESMAAVRLAVQVAGARFVTPRALTAIMADGVRTAVEDLSDTSLMSVIATRPCILHAQPDLSGTLPTPRQSLDHALKASIYAELVAAGRWQFGDGQDENSLPDSVELALAALVEVEASGTLFECRVDVHHVLETGDWDDPWIRSVGMSLAEFLVAQGRVGVGNDLMATIEARDAVMERSAAPGFPSA